jgi:hypothetical protein
MYIEDRASCKSKLFVVDLETALAFNVCQVMRSPYSYCICGYLAKKEDWKAELVVSAAVPRGRPLRWVV